MWNARRSGRSKVGRLKVRKRFLCNGRLPKFTSPSSNGNCFIVELPCDSATKDLGLYRSHC